VHGLDLGLLESEYFAAVAVHAGVVLPQDAPAMSQAPRKIPIAIWVGTHDAFFPLATVRSTRDALRANGFDAKLTEIPNHTHDYSGSSASINREVWAFLQSYRLDGPPKYQQYRTGN